ncbi:MAG TPA: ABC transporter substrate-binding protein [Spirochaetota bacterium]|nr:ABC transporter substrate-binding protein [Spirochaetota bacterium]HPJ41496.1 ABC transporter substrate-binding protein [Spirochaetota bacterium]HPR37723.1 ABC transporter substrate-binding protein [Spirochaetota bacterium]HRX46572.1 ABC transporter substrate-binding protein [Spirochaetota bacterium]
MSRNRKLTILFLSITIIFSSLALTSCKKESKSSKNLIRFASVSWTGVTIKTELAIEILKSIGYEATNTMVSVPIVYQALDSNDADIFLGNWMPSMETIANKYFEKGNVIKYMVNMPGAKYTLAVPSYAYNAGLRDFSDIEKFADKLEYKIYGIEEGNDGNLIIENMIKNNMFNLGKFKLIPSSETGMLAEMQSFMRTGKWGVFLGWSPHSMNEILDMKYLSGSKADTFGENDGTATIYTNIRKGFDKEHPNVALFLKNLKFPVPMMNQIMTILHKNKDMKPKEAGILWLKKNPGTYREWLKDVKTYDGKPALPVFEEHIKTI